MGGYSFVTTASISTSRLRVEVRDNRVDASENLLISQPDFLLGGVMSKPPTPSQGRYLYGDASGYTNIGEVVFSPADIPWQIRTGSGHFRTVTCVYRPAMFHAITRRDLDWQERELSACHDISDMRMHRILEQLGEEVLAPGFASDVLADALGAQLLVEFARHLQSRRSATGSDRDGLEPWQLRRLLEYIHDVDGRQPSLDEMAALCRIGMRTLMRRFKVSTGESVGRYVQHHRLLKAKSLLASSELPLKAISVQLGFSSPSNFSAAFRRAVGMNPSEYRRRAPARTSPPRRMPGL